MKMQFVPMFMAHSIVSATKVIEAMEDFVKISTNVKNKM